MNKDTKKELIKEAIKEYEQEKKTRKKKKAYHNTELLLEHYRELKQHADNAVFTISDSMEVLGYHKDIHNDILDEDDIYIASILKSKIRTCIMVQHIEMALELLKNNAIKDGYKDKYEILEGIYFKDIYYEELADQFSCSSMTIRRWKEAMIDKLSILLFGEESLVLGG